MGPTKSRPTTQAATPAATLPRSRVAPVRRRGTAAGVAVGAAEVPVDALNGAPSAARTRPAGRSWRGRGWRRPRSRPLPPPGRSPGAGRTSGRSCTGCSPAPGRRTSRSEEHTSELQSRGHLVCRLLLEKKKKTTMPTKQRRQEDQQDDLHSASRDTEEI